MAGDRTPREEKLHDFILRALHETNAVRYDLEVATLFAEESGPMDGELVGAALNEANELCDRLRNLLRMFPA